MSLQIAKGRSAILSTHRLFSLGFKIIAQNLPQQCFILYN
jgi:hypothetical protein